MLVIDETGTQLGTMNTNEAVKLAAEKELDLVEVAGSSSPPVCRILDYGTENPYENINQPRKDGSADPPITEGGGDFTGEGLGGMYGDGDDKVDELYDQAVALVARERKASTSFVQRHLQIGYNRAARIVEEMEKQGVIGPANHVGKREILVSDMSEAV